MLTIEQFRNAELAELQTKQNYENVLNYFMGMMRLLIREGTLRNADTEIMAAQFSSPMELSSQSLRGAPWKRWLASWAGIVSPPPPGPACLRSKRSGGGSWKVCAVGGGLAPLGLG